MYNNFTRKTLNQKVQKHKDGSKEYWRDVPGWQGFYRVSDWGRVKSLSRTVIRNCRGVIGPYPVKSRIKKLDRKKNKYIIVGFMKPGVVKAKSLHSVVLEAFVGPCPDGMECRHLDGDKHNNHLSNLMWGTNAEQIADRKQHGTIKRGEGIGNSKLTEDDVREIRKQYRPGVKKATKQLARRFGVSRVSIFNIVNGKTWSHVR